MGAGEFRCVAQAAMAEAGLWLRPQLALPGDGHRCRTLVKVLLTVLGPDCELGAAGDAIVLRAPATTAGGADLMAEVTEGPHGTQVCEFSSSSERAAACSFVCAAKQELSHAMEPLFDGEAKRLAQETGLNPVQMTHLKARLRGGAPLDAESGELVAEFEARLKLLMCKARVAETEPAEGEGSETHQRMKALQEQYAAREAEILEEKRKAAERKAADKLARKAELQTEREFQRLEEEARLQRETARLQQERERREDERRAAEERAQNRREEERRRRSRSRGGERRSDRDRERERSRREEDRPRERRSDRERDRSRREEERSPRQRSPGRDRRHPDERRQEAPAAARPAAAAARPAAAAARPAGAAPVPKSSVFVKQERRWSGDAGPALGRMDTANTHPRGEALVIRDKPDRVQEAAARAKDAAPAARPEVPPLPAQFRGLVELCSEERRGWLTRLIAKEWPENQAPGVLVEESDARGQPAGFCQLCSRKAIDSLHLGEISHLRKLVRSHAAFLPPQELQRRGLGTAQGRLAIAEEQHRREQQQREEAQRVKPGL